MRHILLAASLLIVFVIMGFDISEKSMELERTGNQLITLEHRITELNADKAELLKDNKFLEKVVLTTMENIPSNIFRLPVTVTAYTASEDECNEEPWTTADNSPSIVGVVAVSRDLLWEIGLEYGQTIVLDGLGVYVIRDTMNKRWKRRVDILAGHKVAAKNFGIKNSVSLIWFD